MNRKNAIVTHSGLPFYHTGRFYGDYISWLFYGFVVCLGMGGRQFEVMTVNLIRCDSEFLGGIKLPVLPFKFISHHHSLRQLTIPHNPVDHRFYSQYMTALLHHFQSELGSIKIEEITLSNSEVSSMIYHFFAQILIIMLNILTKLMFGSLTTNLNRIQIQ